MRTMSMIVAALLGVGIAATNNPVRSEAASLREWVASTITGQDYGDEDPVYRRQMDALKRQYEDGKVELADLVVELRNKKEKDACNAEYEELHNLSVQLNKRFFANPC